MRGFLIRARCALREGSKMNSGGRKMKRKLKSALSLLLCMIMVFGALAVGGEGIGELFSSGKVEATENDPNQTSDAITPAYDGDSDSYSLLIEDGWVFGIIDDMVAIYDYIDDNDTVDLVVPSTLRGYPVVQFGLEHGYTLKSLHIPDSVKYISGFLERCINLTKITGCNGVEEWDESYPYITNYRDTKFFQDNKNWVDGLLYVGPILLGAYGSCGKNVKIRPGTRCIAEGAFKENQEIEHVWFPKSIVSIGESAFEECNNLQGVEFEKGSNLREIQDWAFHRCKELSDFSFPNGIKAIGNFAFDECEKLDNIVLPHGITSLGKRIFSETAFERNYDDYEFNFETSGGYRDKFGGIYCGEYLLEIYSGRLGANLLWDYYKINKYEIKDGTVAIAGGCEIGDKVEEIVIPDSVKYIGSSSNGLNYEGALGGSKLKKVNIPSSVVRIGTDTFCDSENLTSIEIPNSVTEIGKYAFWRSGITSITIPESVEIIGRNAFEDTPLSRVVFSGKSSLRTICVAAFAGCKIKSIALPEALKYIDGAAFSECPNLEQVTIPKSVEFIYDQAFKKCSKLKNVIFEQDSNLILISNRAFDNCTGMENISFANCPNLTAIGPYAFSGAENLLHITFNNSLKYLGCGTFSNCKRLSNILLPSEILSIGDYAFMGCESFTHITIPSSVVNPHHYANNMFLNCSSLQTLYINSCCGAFYTLKLDTCPNLTTLVFGERSDWIDVEGIKAVNKIYIHKGIKIIEADSFKDCGALDIYFEGNEDDWGRVTIYDYEYLDNVTIHFNSSILKSPDRVSGVSLPKKKIQMNDSAMLMEATILPDTAVNKDIIWSSSNPNVADFYGDKGVLTAFSNGFTVVTATTADGGYSDSCIVFVGESAMTLRSNGTSDVQIGKESEFNISLIDLDCLSLSDSNVVSVDKNSDKPLAGISAVVSNANVATIESIKQSDGILKMTVKGLKAGTSYITLTNTETGETVYLPINVFDSEAVYSFDTIPQTKIKENCISNFCKNGMNIYDFSHRKRDDGATDVSFNLYNSSWNIGVVEIFDEGGNCINTYSVSPFDNNDLTSVKDNVKRFGTLLKNCFNASGFDEVFDPTTSVASAKTKINTTVPKNGYIRITNDISASTPCLIYNMVDVLVKLIGKVESIAFKGKDKEVTDKVAKTIIEEIAAPFNGSAISLTNKLILEISKSSSFDNPENILECFESLLKFEDIDFNKIFIDTVSGMFPSAAEKLSLSALGSYGKVVGSLYGFNGYMKIMHLLEDCQNYEETGSAYVYDNQAGNHRVSNGITYNGDISEKAVFRTYAISYGKLYDNLIAKNGNNNVKLYEISMVESGNCVQPTSKVQVRIPIPSEWVGDKIEVYRVTNGNSEYTNMNAWKDGNYMVFETDHFSYYTLINKSKPFVSINTPSTTTVSYGFTLNLHANVTDLPEGARIVWSMDGSGFELIPSADGMTCGVKSVSKGSATITAKVVDKNGNAVKDANGNEITASQQLTSKAGFFQKLVAFFKKLFGSNMIIPYALEWIVK